MKNEEYFNWNMKTSANFIFKYPQNSNIEKNIEKIILNRESAFENIAKILGIEIDRKFILFIAPNIEFFRTIGMIPQAAFPDQYFATLIYDEHFPFHTEKFRYGHEIVHLIVYFWDYQSYHLELLEEGLARYLDQSGIDPHYDYLQKLKFSFCSRSIDLSLTVPPFPGRTDYEKAGSFVKFLIEEYGMEKFKEIYLASVLERKNNIFYVNGKKLPAEFLEKLLEEKLDTSFIDIQRNWLSCIGIHL